MPFTIEEILQHPAINQEFYAETKLNSPLYKKFYTAGAQYRIERRIRNQAHWQKRMPVQAALAPRPILLCDFIFESEYVSSKHVGRRHSLLKNLLTLGFKINVLDKSNQLIEIELSKINDLEFLNKLFSNCLSFCKPSLNLNQREENTVETYLRIAGESNPEQWNILDNYTIELILHLSNYIFSPPNIDTALTQFRYYVNFTDEQSFFLDFAIPKQKLVVCRISFSTENLDLIHFISLEHLEIKSTTLKVLSNIPNNLYHLSLTCPRLEIITHLSESYPQVQRVMLENCSELQSLPILLGYYLCIENCQHLIPEPLPEGLELCLQGYSIPRKEAERLKEKYKIKVTYGCTYKDVSSLSNKKSEEKPVPAINRELVLNLDDNIDPSNEIKYIIHYALYHSQEGKISKVPPSSYRHNIHNAGFYVEQQYYILQNCQTIAYTDTAAWPINNKTHFNYSDIRALAPNQFFAELPLKPRPYWQALPGLSPTDWITQIKKPIGSPLRYKHSTGQYEILWDKNIARQNSYKLQYIFQSNTADQLEIKNQPGSIIPNSPPLLLMLSLSILLNQAPPIYASPEFKTLQTALLGLDSFSGQAFSLKILHFCQNALVDFFNSFKNEPLDPIDENQPEFQRILIQSKGVCRHRALLYVLLSHYLGVTARVISNELHVFVELYVNGQWQIIDLGGSQVIIEDHTSSLPQLENTTPDYWQAYFSPLPQAAAAGESKSLTCDEVLLALAQKKNALLQIAKVTEGRNIYAALQRLKLNRPIFYLELPEQIDAHWRLFEISPEGELKQNIPGRLKKIIQTGGILIFNWSRFNANQIASYMSINDEKRIFKGDRVSDDLSVINLVTPQIPAGDRFYSRSPEFFWPSKTPRPPIISILPSIIGEEEEEKKDFIKLDFYGGVIEWETAFTGTMEWQESKYYYQPGVLQQALEAKKSGLMIIDGPYQDPAFQCFILDLQLQGEVKLNNKTWPIPPDFSFKLKAASTLAGDNKFCPPPGAAKAQKFYLNPNNFLDLFQQQIINEKSQLQIISGGWLQFPTDQAKHIVLTGPLSAGQKRYFYERLAKHPKPVIVEELDEKPGLTRAYDSVNEIAPIVKLGSAIIETQDPYFVARQVGQLEKQPLLIAIHAQSEASDLFELVSEPADSKQGQLSWQIQAVADALLKKRTVILYGQLSDEFYQRLESVFGFPSQLKLLNAVSLHNVTGKLLIITRPLKFIPRLAQQQGRHIRLPAVLWSDYQTQLSPSLAQASLQENWEKIEHFYALAAVRTNPCLSDLRLRQFLKALEHTDNDNPIKGFFHHDFEPGGEDYAYFNVLAKLLLSPQPGKRSIKKQRADIKQGASTQPRVRLGKLEHYPNDLNHCWRRFNCYNGEALRQMFKVRMIHPESPLALPLVQTNGKLALEIIFQEYSPKVKPIETQSNPQAKTQAQLVSWLLAHSVVTLVGKSGTGKTDLALGYAQQAGRGVFWGESAIIPWLKSSAAAGKEQVLILDQADRKPRGYWNFLMPLLALELALEKDAKIFYQSEYSVSLYHKVIFACNPIQYSTDESNLDVIQNSRRIYLKPWTGETLKTQILAPLILQIMAQKGDDKQTQILSQDQSKILNLFLKALQIIAHLLAPSLGYLEISEEKCSLPAHAPVLNEQLTIRDARQLILRWHYQLYQSQRQKAATLIFLDWQQAAYEACLLEFGHSFTPIKNLLFQSEIKKLFQPQQLEIQKFAGMDEAGVRLRPIAQRYFLCSKQYEWLLIVDQDMQLAKFFLSIKSRDGAALIKSGTLLEGESGLGKTSLLLSLAKERELKPYSFESLLESPALADLSRYYIQCSAGADPEQDPHLLTQSFDKGCLVILDELNLAPELETQLNPILSGKTPEGRPPQRSGFHLWASQNGYLHMGSKQSSAAVKNRLHVLYTRLTDQDLIETVEIALTPLGLAVNYLKLLAGAITTAFLREQQKHPQRVNTRTFFQQLKPIVRDIKQKLADSKSVSFGNSC